MVNSLEPPKKGFASFNRGSTCVSIAFCISCAIFVCSSSPSALSKGYMCELTFEMKVSANKLTLARKSGEYGSLKEGGRRWDGRESAKNCATMADSMMISSFRMPFEYLMLGTKPRYRSHVSSGRRLRRLKLPYRVHLEIPWFTRCVKVDDDFLVLQSQLFQCNVRPMRPRAPMVGVQSDLWLDASTLQQCIHLI